MSRVFLLALVCVLAAADMQMFQATCNFAQTGATTAPNTNGTCAGWVYLDTVTGLSYANVTYFGLAGTYTQSHIHKADTTVAYAMSVVSTAANGVVTLTGVGNVPVTASDLANWANGLYYVNIHTNLVPAGEIRGQLQLITDWVAASLDPRQAMNGPSPAFGGGYCTLTASSNTINCAVNWFDLTGPCTGVHIHGPSTMGANTGVIVDFTVPTGAPTTGRQTYSGVVSDAVFWAIRSGNAYFAVHTSTNNPEIRGQIRQANTNVAALLQNGFYTMPCTNIAGSSFYMKGCMKFTNGVVSTYAGTFSDAACNSAILAANAPTGIYAPMGFAIEPFMKNYDNVMTRTSGSAVVGIPAGTTNTLCPNNILVGGKGTTVTAATCPGLFTPSWNNMVVDNPTRYIAPTDSDDDRRVAFMRGALNVGNYTYQAAMTSCPDYVAMYFNGSSFVVPAFTLLAAIFAMFALLF